MLKIKVGFAVLFAALFTVGTDAAAQKPGEKKWKLVWNDEFDYKGLPDDKRWGYDTGKTGWGNNELQNYTFRDTATANVRDGFLHLTANRNVAGLDTLYTSARLVTKNKGDWKYGKIEVKAKVTEGKGICSAIWMLPTKWKYGRWPTSGEIDIMEHVYLHKDTIFQTVHTGAYNHTKGTQKGNKTFVNDLYGAFHVYTVTWTPDAIDYFIDGKHTGHFPNEGKTPDEWPFDSKFHLLLNISVGGNWEGKRGVDPATFPATLQVDYVRVYREKK